jgi:hypothetical protein
MIDVECEWRDWHNRLVVAFIEQVLAEAGYTVGHY